MCVCVCVSHKYRMLKFESDVIALLDSGQQENRSDRLRACGLQSFLPQMGELTALPAISRLPCVRHLPGAVQYVGARSALYRVRRRK
jgi:hypothetical protein